MWMMQKTKQIMRFMYLVLGHILGREKIVIASNMSLNTLHCTLVWVPNLPTFCSSFSSIKLIKGINVLSPLFISIISASVVLIATSVSILMTRSPGIWRTLPSNMFLILLLICQNGLSQPSILCKSLLFTTIPCFVHFLF